MKTSQVSVAALACSVMVQGLAMAQAAAPAPAEFLQVITIKAKPAAIAEYEDYVKKVIGAAVKVGAPQRVVFYQAVMGAPLGTYLGATPFANWDEVDGFLSIPFMLNKAYGEVEGPKILRAGRAAIESAEIDVYRTRLDLSTNPKSFDPPTAFVSVTRTELRPEMAPDYDLMIGKIKKAEEALPNPPTVVRRVMVQGPGEVVIAARYFNKFADVSNLADQPALIRKTYGDDEARQIGQTIGRAIAKRERWVLAYRADLSKLAGSTK